MRAMTRTATFDAILRVWDTGLGRYEQNWGPRFKSYFVLGLDAPTLSLSLFIGDRFTKADLLANEENFRKERPEILRPYVTLPDSDGAPALTALAENGYAKENVTSYCFTKAAFADPNEGRFQVESGDFESPQVFADYSRATVSILNLKNPTIPEFNRRLNHELGTPNRVLNFRRDGEIAGTSCFTMFGDVCMLYGDSVYPKFRGNGMWKTMTAVRQNLSRELGAKVWFLQTSHSYLSKNFESKLDFSNFRKAAPRA